MIIDIFSLTAKFLSSSPLMIWVSFFKNLIKVFKDLRFTDLSLKSKGGYLRMVCFYFIPICICSSLLVWYLIYYQCVSRLKNFFLTFRWRSLLYKGGKFICWHFLLFQPCVVSDKINYSPYFGPDCKVTIKAKFNLYIFIYVVPYNIRTL